MIDLSTLSRSELLDLAVEAAHELERQVIAMGAWLEANCTPL